MRLCVNASVWLRQQDPNDVIVKDLKHEIQSLKDQVARTPVKSTVKGQEVPQPEKITMLEAMLADMERAQLTVG
jgi:hypothetical protein